MRARRGRPAVAGILACLAPLALAPPALAADFLPLRIGHRWEYVAPGGGREVLYVAATVRLPRGEAYAIRYSGNPGNAGLENYWTAGEDGDVLLWGFFRPEGWGYLYDPAVVLADAPLEPGKSWGQRIWMYALPETALVDSFDIAFEVYEEGPVAVPAGTFHAFGIGQRFPALAAGSPLAAHSLAGLPRAAAGFGPSDWWSEGIGEVQYGAGEFYRLAALAVTGAPPAAPGAAIRLGPARPNPARAAVVLTLELDAAQPARVEILDPAGRLVRRLDDGAPFAAGIHALVWDRRDAWGARVPSGVYLVRARAGATERGGRIAVLD